MSHTYRFFGDRGQQGDWELRADEIKHLINVLRLNVGEKIELATGRGWVARATITARTKSKIEFTKDSEVFSDLSSDPVILILGSIKPKDMDDVIPALSEIGVDHFIVYQQAETNKKRLNDKKSDRYDRIIESATKQCKRSWSLGLELTSSLEEAVTRAAELTSSKNLFILEPGVSQAFITAEYSGSGGVLVVGGEKGLLKEELAHLAKQAYRQVHIGAHVLRARTAAVVGAAELLAKGRM
jgi:16S rRNA (uracil1498-N3)-methyltransferase